MVEPIGFHAFVVERSPALLRAAWLLTGDWAAAEDLVQTALVRCWPRWSQLDSPEAYVRRTLVHTYVGIRRRRAASELVSDDLPDWSGADPGYDRVDLGDAVQQALAALPRRQRAAVVLRYFLDLSESDTAAAMHCSVGTVKSTTHKALAALRSSPVLVDPVEGR